jgi:hypothetical protein
VVIFPIAWFGSRLRKVSRSSQDRVADIGAMTAEVLGAIRIVQAFGQEGRERALSGAVERTFDTARRRIMIRAVMTAVVIFLVMGGITALMWQGAGRGQWLAHRRHHRRIRADRRDRRGVVRGADRSLWRSAARRGRGRAPQRTAARTARHRAPGAAHRPAQPAARRAGVPERGLPLSQPPGPRWPISR